MKQALEALEKADKIRGFPNNKKAITALRQAIEQAQKQEPVAWDGKCVLGHCGSPSGCEDSHCCRANYTTLPQRQPLTDEQLLAVYETEQQGRWGDHVRGLRAVEEAAHGIKGEE